MPTSADLISTSTISGTPVLRGWQPQGASLAEIMRRGGHSTPSAALVYQHATEDRDKELAAALGDLARTADSVVAAWQGVSTNAHRMLTEQLAS